MRRRYGRKRFKRGYKKRYLPRGRRRKGRSRRIRNIYSSRGGIRL